MYADDVVLISENKKGLGKVNGSIGEDDNNSSLIVAT